MSLITDPHYLLFKLSVTQNLTEPTSSGKLALFPTSYNDYILTDTTITTPPIPSSPDIIPSLLFSPRAAGGSKRGLTSKKAIGEGDLDLIYKSYMVGSEGKGEEEEEILSEIDLEGEDDDDDDIDLDYDEVIQEVKPIMSSKLKSLIRPKEPGIPEMATSIMRPDMPVRKYSNVNLHQQTHLPPGVIQPKSRMRSLSSSSVGAALPITSTHNNVTASPLKFDTPSKLKTQITPAQSLLGTLLKAKTEVLDNPFLTEFGNFTGKGDLNAMELSLYLSHSTKPSEPMMCLVKRTATVEQVIGFALYTYTDLKLEPKLEVDMYKTSCWSMRIAEDDGTIDDDFPALERSRQIDKFGFDSFALCSIAPMKPPVNKNTPAIITTTTTSTAGNVPARLIPPSPTLEPLKGNYELPVTPGLASFSGITQLIKIQLYTSSGALHTTTLNIPATTSLSSIQALVCRKWGLNRAEYELTSRQAKNALDQGASLESLLGITELSLVKVGLNLNLNPQSMYHLSSPTIYKKYTVYRRQVMFVTKQERILAIDGVYLQLLPPERTTTHFNHFGTDANKISSYHLSSLVVCRIHKKVRRRFKLVVVRIHDTKTYDLEAKSPELALEICELLLSLAAPLKVDKPLLSYE